MSAKQPRKADRTVPLWWDTDDTWRRRCADIDEAHKMKRARLRTLRLYFGLTDQEMAARLGMSKRAYAAWETPERSTRGATLFSIRLAEQFDASIDWLVIGGQPNGQRNDDVPQTLGGGPLPLPTRH